MKKILFIVLSLLFLSACTGSRKYYKLAERLEKKGLVGDAAGYYLISLQRKPTNVDARIKLQTVGQKHVSNLSSDFFRNYNTQQMEASLEVYQKLKNFTSQSAELNVILDYPRSYEEDYQNAVTNYCSKNYEQAYFLVHENKYDEALRFISNIKKYDPNYKSTQKLEIIAFSEPLYQSAIIAIESKDYVNALNFLSQIKTKTDDYKDFSELYNLSAAQVQRKFILLKPDQSGGSRSENDIEDDLYDKFSQVQIENVSLINNSLFNNAIGTGKTFNDNAEFDLIQAIRKASGANFFYIYEISDVKISEPRPTKITSTAYREVRTKKNDVVITEYKPIKYTNIKATRKYSYDFQYKIINALTGQIVASQIEIMTSKDEIEYNEFAEDFSGNINDVFPYNPQNDKMHVLQPKSWRKLFSATKALKSIDELKNEVNATTMSRFTSTVAFHIK